MSQIPEADAAFAKAEELMKHADPRTGGSFKNAAAAIDLYKQAATLDPKLAKAWVQIARAWNMQGYSDPDAPPADVITRNVNDAAQRAVSIDPNLPEAHALLASIYFLTDYDWPKAESEYRWTIARDPNNAQAHSGLAQLLGTTGRFDEALKEAKIAEDLRKSPIDAFVLARTYYSMRNYDEAVANCRRALAMQENQAFRFYLGLMLLAQGHSKEGVTELENAGNQPNNNAGAVLGQAYGYAATGRRDEALALIKKVEATHAEAQIPAYRRAAVYLALGDKSKALDDLWEEYRERGNWIVQLKVDPVMDPLRGEPEFRKLMRTLKLG